VGGGGSVYCEMDMKIHSTFTTFFQILHYPFAYVTFILIYHSNHKMTSNQ